MTLTFENLGTPEGIGKLNEHLLTRSYITGYQASRDDILVFDALSEAPAAGDYPHASRWYNHIKALLDASFPGKAEGVTVEGVAATAAAKVEEEEEEEDLGKDVLADDDDDEDLDLFGEMTEEEKAAAEEKKRIIEAKKEKSRQNALKSKSMIILDIKPWDDTTDLQKMEEEVRAVKRDGLLWGKAELVPVGYGIKKIRIGVVIEDAKVPSMDEIIEDELVRDGESENIQSIDIVSFNKL